MKLRENKGMSLIVFTIILAVLLVVAGGVIAYLLNNPKVVEKTPTGGENNVVNNESTETNKNENIINEENKIDTSYLKVYGVGNDFKNLEDVAKLNWNSFEDTANKVLEYDLDNDGKKETITTEYKENDEDERSYIVINNKEFKIGYYPISNIYIVDLDKNDKTIEIIALQQGDSGAYACDIGIYNNDKFEKIKDLEIYGESILVNENGKIIFEWTGYCNPILTEEYYVYNNRTIKIEKPNLENIATQEFMIEKEHVYYTKETPEKVWDEYSNSSKTMEECGIYKFEKDTKVNIIEYGTHPTSEVIKAKLENGNIIYIMSEIFYTA